MTPSFNDLYKKTIELEERLDKLNKTISNNEIDTKFSLFNNNCINATVITQKQSRLQNLITINRKCIIAY